MNKNETQASEFHIRLEFTIMFYALLNEMMTV